MEKAGSAFGSDKLEQKGRDKRADAGDSSSGGYGGSSDSYGGSSDSYGGSSGSRNDNY